VERDRGQRDGDEGPRERDGVGQRARRASLAALVRRAEELAALAPVDPEWTPPLGPQRYASRRRSTRRR
jgi:hypothetical protein